MKKKRYRLPGNKGQIGCNGTIKPPRGIVVPIPRKRIMRH